MMTDKRTLSEVKDRKQVIISFNKSMVTQTGLTLGTAMDVIFGNKQITIIDDIERYITQRTEINDDIHKLIEEKQKELIQKYGIEIKIEDIINKILKENIQTFDIVQRSINPILNDKYVT